MGLTAYPPISYSKVDYNWTVFLQGLTYQT